MITAKDLQEAIAECQGTRNPNANTCIKLAAYYTILNNMEREVNDPVYSYDSGPINMDSINFDSRSEFSQIINGQKTSDVLLVMDELMDTLKIINPKLYDGVMRKLY